MEINGMSDNDDTDVTYGLDNLESVDIGFDYCCF